MSRHHIVIPEYKFSFWHPALPEVRVNHRGPAFCEVYSLRPAEQRREEPNWPWHRVNRLRRTIVAVTILPLLLLPLAANAEPCKVNVNTASSAQLALLVNTGPALASKIEAARKPEPLDAAKLDAIPGIGPKWLEYNGLHVAYSGETTCKDKLKKPSATGETESDTVRKEASGGGQ